MRELLWNEAVDFGLKDPRHVFALRAFEGFLETPPFPCSLIALDSSSESILQVEA